MTAAAHVDQDTIIYVVIKPVLYTVLITYVLLMDRASVLKAITAIDVKIRALTIVKPVPMAPSVQYVLLVDTVHCVTLSATVREAYVIW